jgi:ribosomal protein L29
MAIPAELKKKTSEELAKILHDLRANLREARFKAVVRDLKSVRDIRVLKKKIAHILTLMNAPKK